jgi:hypothetical protein
MNDDEVQAKSHTGDENGSDNGPAQDREVVYPEPTLRPLLIIFGLLLLLIPAVLILEYDRPPRYWPRDFYAVDQVILTGTKDELDAAIAEIEVDNYVERIDVLEFDDELLKAPACSALNERYGGDDGQMIALYQITRRLTNPVEIIERIQEDQQVQGEQATAALATGGEGAQQQAIRAEPNWISGQPWEIEGSPWEIEGSPWEIEGSPWEIEGSPWEIEGSPWEIEGSADEAGAAEEEVEAIDAFLNQLALALVKNVSSDGNEDEAGEGEAKGQDQPPDEPRVLVGVFDTSPFTTAVGVSQTLPVTWLNKPADLQLLVEHLVPTDPSPRINFNHHGLFVAGIVHAVAPNSDIQLVRVLDGDNKGDLFTLMKALNAFIAKAGGDTDAVINLSLGMRLIPEEGEGYEELSRELGALRDVIAFAECSDIVVVAAAGNGSANKEKEKVLDAYYPAAWPDVIGVAASNADNDRACYSNRGDVAAPGGDGHPKKDDCRPLHYTCENVECKFGVLGPVYQNKKYKDGFAYWVGSSFSTPIVSGLAAKIQQQEPGLSREAVRWIIECSAENSSDDSDLGAGVIDVEKALGACMVEYHESYTGE